MNALVLGLLVACAPIRAPAPAGLQTVAAPPPTPLEASGALLPVASVLAAPNRSDIPPQITLRYQASDRLGVQGSFDSQGRWQTQLQLYYRF
jgi:hypothetical protein